MSYIGIHTCLQNKTFGVGFDVEAKEGRVVTFGDNVQEHIIRFSNIDITPSIYIEMVVLMEWLKYNLLNINQLCDKNF